MSLFHEFMISRLDPNNPHDVPLIEAFERRIRGGKLIKKKVKPKSKRKGYKVSGNKIKRMGAIEKLHRTKGRRAAKKKLRSQQGKITRHRKKSMKKRRQIIGK